MSWYLLVVWSLATYRLSRFIVLDTIFGGIRALTERRLVKIAGSASRLLAWLAGKLYDLIGCPYCVTVWVAAGVLLAHRIAVGPFPIPVWQWLAVSAASLVVWAVVDNDEKPPLPTDEQRIEP